MLADGHACGEGCHKTAVTHAVFGEPGGAPTECEKEAFTGAANEHRSGTTIKLNLKKSAPGKDIHYENCGFGRNTAITPALLPPVATGVSPHILNCVFRL